MITKSLAALSTLAVLAASAACGGGDEPGDETSTTREVITQPGTKEVEVTVPTVDTAVVERTVETNVEVDTIDEPEIEATDP
jgi:ABC-type glycerol-3-phosphate transport system substrate-binding protein